MAIYKKTFKPNPPADRGPPLTSSTDHKRTFDARPKPSDDRRREERARPESHIDRTISDPLDEPEAASDEEA